MRLRVILVFFVPAVLLVLTVWFIVQYIRRIRQCGLADKTAEGTVTKVRSRAFTKDLYKFTAFVRYEADGRVYETKNLPYAENTPECPFKEGDAVTVHYPADHPECGFVRDGMRSPAEGALVAACCFSVLLFVFLLVIDSLVWWFTLPERKLIGAVRLAGMALVFLGFGAAAIWLYLSRRRAVPATGTVREVKRFGKQTALLTACQIDGEERVLLIPKEPSDKREYAAGDSIELRVPRDASQTWIWRKQSKGNAVLCGFTFVLGLVCLLNWLLEDLFKLLKM